MSYRYNKIVVKVKRKVRVTKIAPTTTFPTYLFYLVLQIILNEIAGHKWQRYFVRYIVL